MNGKGLTDREIALIKTVQARGKSAGFTAQKILSYFSRPERTINVARLYEIHDDMRGANVPAASEEDLHSFLTKFGLETPPEDDQKRILRYRPAPAFLGVREGRVCLLPRKVDQDDMRLSLREKLVSEQHRLTTILATHWTRFQVDQRLSTHMEHYAEITSKEHSSKEHSSLNIFELDDEFRVLRRAVGTETGGFGEIGETQWENFCRNHMVLADLYPEMREYRAALLTTSPSAELAEEEAHQATAVLRDPDGQRYVSPDVPELIQVRLDEATDDPEANRKRAYDVAALLNMAGTLLLSIFNLHPRAATTTAAAFSLWDRLWRLLRVILQRMGW